MSLLLPPVTRPCHQCPSTANGTSVDTAMIFRSESGLPIAVSMLSNSWAPACSSHAPHSSSRAYGVSKRPNAVLGFEPISRKPVRVAGCLIAMRLAPSVKSYPPFGSMRRLATLKQILACSKLPATSTDSVPGRNRTSPGSRMRSIVWAARVAFPLPLTSMNAADDRLMAGSSTALRKRR